MTDQVIDDETQPEDVPEIDQFPDGVYLHMPEDTYHAQHRLSASGVNKLRASEADFWHSSWMNPDHDDKTTDAQLLGRAFHTARLEPHMLEKRFVRDLDSADMPEGCLFTDTDVKAAIKALLPKPEDHPEALRTDTDVKNALAEAGQQKTVTGESAEDRKERLRQHSAGAVFWSDIVAEWENENGPMKEPDKETPSERAHRLLSYGYEGAIWTIEREKFEVVKGDRTSLPRKFWDQVMQDVADLHSSPLAEKYLTGGLAEVTVLWTDTSGTTPVQWKARIDYLRPDLYTDAKTFVNQRGKAVRECLADAFRYNGYFIQARIYREATDEIRAGLDLIDATEEEATVIEAIRKREGPLLCVYLFQQKEGIPNVMACPVRLDMLHPSLDAAAQGVDPEKIAKIAEKYSQPTLICRRAEHEIAEAVERYVACMERYGEDKKWRPLEPEFTIDDNAFNGFWLEGEWA